MPAPHYDHNHGVQFYNDERDLYVSVATFLARGLVDVQPAVMIATPSHATAILEELRERMIDTNKAQQVGSLVVLDAEKTLEAFMAGGVIHAERFEASVGAVIERMARQNTRRGSLRAYGEMVDVLWKRGQREAAIELEMLWNKLAGVHGFALLCGYAMGNFYNETTLFEEVCRQHTHVMPASQAH